MKVLSLLVALLFVGLSAAEESEGSALLIIRKTVETPENVFAVGINITVTLDVYNIGEKSATNVDITDPWPLQSFDLIDGTNEMSWEEIPAGESVKHVFTFQPLVDGTLQGFGAHVSYMSTEDEDAEPQIGMSSKTFPITIYPRAVYDKYIAKHYEEWSVFLSAAGSTIVLPFVYWMYIQHAYENGIPRTKAKSE